MCNTFLLKLFKYVVKNLIFKLSVCAGSDPVLLLRIWQRKGSDPTRSGSATSKHGHGLFYNDQIGKAIPVFFHNFLF